MSIFKRLSATLVSRIDHVVGEIENHDAVVKAALDDMRNQIARAKVHLGQVRREQARLQEQINEQQDNTRRWRERAVACSESDESKALECVRRGRQCRQRARNLEQTLAGYESTAAKLASDIETSEQRLVQNKQKHTLMRARQSTGSALNATGEEDNGASLLLDDTFDRWEIKVTQAEMTSDSHAATDPLERDFTTREQREELRRELEALLAEEGRK